MKNIESKVFAIFQRNRKSMLSQRELIKRAGLKKKDAHALREVLPEMVRVNQLVETDGRYQTPGNLGLLAAEIVKVTGTFGFARPLEEEGKDIFVPGRHLKGAMPGDIVLLRKSRGTGELPEGKVYKVVQETSQLFLGIMHLTDEECYIMPDRYVRFPIQINRRHTLQAKDGDKILAEITRRGERHNEHRARVVQVFGSSDQASACCEAILTANDIHPAFPPEVLEQARAIASGSGIHPKEMAVRLDLRDENIFTIDSADSKDLDDAISLHKTEEGWELGVHIADVSYYVTYRTPLDMEAFARGTSVYYADSVIPMLPPEISNGICSLNPNEDRLAFSAIIRLDKQGNILDSRFKKTVIRSKVKGVYSEVNAILAGTASPEVLEKYDGLQDMIADMNELASILTKKRFARGGINLESVESKIIVGADGRAVDVVERQRGQSEQVIEEFMLTANEAAASLALKLALPFIYRVHEKPDPEKLEDLYEVLSLLGIPFKRAKGKADTQQLSSILESVKNTDYNAIVNTMILRSMAKAKYSEHNIGHFGLALKDYTHFTSPIRRYPDLTIHRILSGFVTGMKNETIMRRYSKFVAVAAKHSTEREIAAMTAERDCEDCYKAEYMSQFIGEEFEGIISSATSFGVYIRLPNTVEGLLHISNFPSGEWDYDGHIAFTERKSGKKIRLGDTIRVLVAATDVSAGNIDFKLVDAPVSVE